jgi:hypothetical protein
VGNNKYLHTCTGGKKDFERFFDLDEQGVKVWDELHYLQYAAFIYVVTKLCFISYTIS